MMIKLTSVVGEDTHHHKLDIDTTKDAVSYIRRNVRKKKSIPWTMAEEPGKSPTTEILRNV